MKNTDKQTLDMLRGEFAKSAETAKVPLKLQKESIVTMLKNSDKETESKKDFSSKAGNKGDIVVLKRVAAAAAAVAIGVGVLNSGMGRVKVIKTDTFYEGYENMEPVKNVKSYDDIEKIVKEIFDKKSSQSKNPQADKTDKNETESVTKDSADHIIEGYSEYVAQANIDESPKYGDKEVPQVAVEGVVSHDEFKADIVKNNGEYLYIATTGVNETSGATVEQIRIVKVVPAEGMKVVSTIPLYDGTDSEMVDECIEIYLKNNTLVALINRYSFTMSENGVHDNAQTVAVHYDISDPTAPKKVREHIQDGKYITSGLYENKLNIVTEKTISSVQAQAETEVETSGVIPSYSVDGEVKKLDAEDIFVAANDPEASYLFITVTDISDYQAPISELAMLGCGKEVYCTAKTVAVVKGFVSVDTSITGKRSSLSEIYRFNTDGSSITFAGSYVVEGTVVGGVSVDEENGYFRVVTDAGNSYNFYILNEKTEFVSGLTELSSGKDIKGVKYIGSNVYFVAGNRNEKTLIADLSDPANPVVAGKISTDDFSQELYSMSDTALIGIGVTDKSSIRISLFDVSDPNNPQTAAEYTLEGDCSLPGADDTRSVLLDTEKKIFGLPIIKTDPATGAETSSYVLFDVSQGEIKPIGTFDHDNSHTGDAAVRGVLIDGTLYTVSGVRVTAFTVENGTTVSSKIIR